MDENTLKTKSRLENRLSNNNLTQYDDIKLILLKILEELEKLNNG